MVGLPPGDGTLVLRKMMENKKIQVMKDKIYVPDVTEIAKETAYYRKMQRIEKTRRESAAWN
jgi:phosphoenolpyruvate synthase/pyruvate phosphate dikinase